ncbi:PadR family transcriptional regulator [Actinomadura rupiterrae]|uniref:PadR family transcriptional regulator n=1 Tax=Actinomadura rupiterrae TaxID=559627 RepID=UPI0020A5EF5D|nr:PadR family transcriptional regulator [Actinomadura rupiterrae]MCP2336614.1 DNA-binding PadR family transcriptional regulator [Actinomadura rupiterrae]
MPESSPQDYVVLGLIERHGPMTPYELKAKVEESVDYFWPIPHAQLYRIPARLAEQGLLLEEQEETGRRRRVFHLTEKGRDALRSWLADPDAGPAETRDPSQVKLFFADLAGPEHLAALAGAQVAEHEKWLARYKDLRASLAPDDLARQRLLDLGIAHEASYVEYWKSLLD